MPAPDPWSGFEEVTPSAPASPPPSPRRAVPALGQRVLGAVDGDTVRLDPGPNLRLWGVDAPELRQPGWRRDGSQVQIGRQSMEALQAYLNSGTPEPGPEAMRSYGRPVAPVSVNGADVGQSLLRAGNAFAAPDYLSNDRGRLFGYMQAERLARLNRLGVHGLQMQTPAEFRQDPQYVAPRRNVGQSWHTPTPFNGMSAAAEQEYVRLLETGSKQDIMGFVESQGFRLAEDDVDQWVRGRDAFAARGEPLRGSVLYAEDAPRPLTDNGDGAEGALVRALGNGFAIGGLDELGAVADALGGTDGRENIWNSDRRFADIWLNNQQQNAAMIGYDREFHPVASTTGEVVGGLTSGFILPYSAGARSMPQLARIGAAYGATEGFLDTNGTLPQRLTGAAIGAPLGFVAEPLLGKAADYALPRIANAAGRALGAARDGAGAVIARGRQAMARNDNPADEWAGFETVAEAPPAGAGEAVTGNQVKAMEGEAMPAVSGPAMRPLPVGARDSEAVRQAAAENLTPGEVLPIPGNTVRNVEEAAAIDAGRFEPVRPVNERTELTRRTVRNYAGREVPTVGPVDMVGWLRLNGGLADYRGELSSLGITNNAARRGLDFVGQETRFGPILNENGMSLDDAANAAWEAGYFPELTERPTVNEFLDALGETYNGGAGRRFVAEDAPELEAYYGRQDERYAVERQQFETGQPVYRDLSQPADDAQPFAPPEAYEEWPDGGPDLAGNIRLDKLESPQDIARALAQTERRVSFDAETRGRVTQAETERLAADLNMSVEQLLSRRTGQAFNAEEALAARQLLAKSGNELVNAARRVQQLDNPGDEVLAEFRAKWMRHVAIQEQVAGMTAEAGRALQQFRQVASSRAVRGDLLNAYVRGGGGPDSLRDAAEAILDAVEVSPGVFNQVAQLAAKPKLRDKIAELYINMLLSGPQTHAANIASNTLTSMAQIPEYAGAALIGKARQAFSRQQLDRIVASEVGARAFGLMQGAREGVRMFGTALRTGDASDFVSKVEGDQFKAISGLKGEVIRVPTRLLTAEDEFFKGVARRMEMNAQAVRIARREGLRGDEARARIAELSANPTEEMQLAALDYGRYLTFQRQLGPIASKVSAVTNESLVAKIFLPFVRTPTNLLKFALERSPAAPIMREWRKDFKAGGERRDLAIARATIGTGMGMLIYEAALQGHITGSAPSDPAKARLLYADGWKPYSIRIGDTYYSYRRLDPFSTTLGVAADMATLPDNMSERQRDDKTTLLVASIMGNLASKTWLAGISDLMGALEDPERNAGTLLERLAGAFTVTTGVNQVARLVDPVQRETGSMGEAIQNRIPGLSQSLLPRRDIWGQPIVNQGGVGPDIVSPLWKSRASNDPVNLALLQIDYAPGYPSRKIGGQELTPEQYDAYLAQSGQLAHDELARVVTSPEWQAMDDDSRVDQAQRIVRQARAAAREALFGGGPAVDEWADFEVVE